MGKRRRQSRRDSDSQPAETPAGGLDSILTLLLWALFFARWLLPTEGSPEGETLWLSTFTLPVTALWFWWQSKQLKPRLSPGLLDVAVWSLAGAHILSAILVIAGEGDKRLALNMLWEWFSLAVLVSTLRQTLLTEAARDRFRQVIVTLGVALAVFGIWQHYYWYGSNIAEYRVLRAELDELNAASSLTPEQAERRLDLLAQFQSDNIPLHEPQRSLFERRLLDSKEPLGFFALANSFAGVLVVVTVLLAAGLMQSLLAVVQTPPEESSSSGQPSLRAWLIENSVQAGCLIVVGFTLLLTKSRTSFVGAAAGIGVAGLLCLAGLKKEALKRVLTVAAVGAVLLAVLIGGAFATGSLDIEVLSEAPKSLEYRLFYWRGTARVIAESPWFGVGPGNFRPHYLQHKLPETSEEISDPHNFVLDVVANAGVLGALALLLLAGVVLRNGLTLASSNRAATDTDSLPKSQAGQPEFDGPSVLSVVLLAAGIVFAWQFVAEAALNLRLLSTAAVAIGICLAADRLNFTTWPAPGSGLSAVASFAAISALLVHLLAAGGIAMPAICGSLLVLAILAEPASPPATSESEDASASPRVILLVLAIALATGFATCLKTAFIPVIQSTTALRSGDFEGTRHSRFDRARRLYSVAAESDPFSPEPLMRLSDVSFLLWEQRPGANEHFGEGVSFALEAQKRNPQSGFYAYQIGRRHSQLFQRNRDRAAAESAVEWLGKALEKYPTHPLWNAEYTLALHEAGQAEAARVAARKTFEMDKVNRDAGHIDRYLPDPVLEAVARIAEIEIRK
mgnify:CR=1 FL=1